MINMINTTSSNQNFLVRLEDNINKLSFYHNRSFAVLFPFAADMYKKLTNVLSPNHWNYETYLANYKNLGFEVSRMDNGMKHEFQFDFKDNNISIQYATIQYKPSRKIQKETIIAKTDVPYIQHDFFSVFLMTLCEFLKNLDIDPEYFGHEFTIQQSTENTQS